MKVRAYEAGDAQRWDALVNHSLNGTFLHTRRFLAYHGDRFQDASAVIETDHGALLGVFAAAPDRADPHLIVSHPGITYGGVVTPGDLRGAAMIEALGLLARFYADRTFTRLRYKAVPGIYHRRPASDDLYALFRLGAKRYRCDLSSTIDVAARGTMTHGRDQGIRKAQKAGVRIDEGHAFLEPFWQILAENLSARHGVAPVHSLEEIRRLAELFPEQIRCVVGELQGHVLAGVVLFCFPTALHCQYIGSTETGRELAALDLVVDACIASAAERNARWFSFGHSTEQEGSLLNSGLYEYKTSYGAGSTVQDFYELALI